MRSKWMGYLAMALMLAASPVRAETLADALIAAYRNSNLLDQNQALLRAADEDAAIAVSNLRPIINFTLETPYDIRDTPSVNGDARGVNESFVGEIGLTARILVWAGGSGRMAIELARESVLATRAALLGIEQQVLLAAISAYVDVRLQAEFVALGEANLRLLEQQLQATRDRFEVGEVTLTDVAEAESRLAGGKLGLVSAQGNAMLARERYKAATGNYPGNLARESQLPTTAKSLEDAKNVAVRTHPDIIRAQHQVRVSELRVAIARTDFGPNVVGTAQATQDFEGFNTSTINLTFVQPIYSGGGISALYRQSLAGEDSARAALLQTAVDVSENVGRAWTLILVARASIAAGKSQVEAAQIAFDGVTEEAKLGARTTLDVLNSQQELLNARSRTLQATAELYNGTYQLLAAMGLLTVEHLNLGIPTYDPEAYFNAVKNAPATSAQGKRLDRILKTIGN